MKNEDYEPQPWYRQAWPWFLLALPASVVVAGLLTLFIAIEHDDALVRDDYYREGLAINRDLAAEKTARDAGIGGRIEYDADAGLLFLHLRASPPGVQSMQLEIVHPTDSSMDRVLDMEPFDQDTYVARLPHAPGGKRRLLLHGASPDEREWRLRGEWQAGSRQASLEPGVY